MATPMAAPVATPETIRDGLDARSRALIRDMQEDQYLPVDRRLHPPPAAAG